MFWPRSYVRESMNPEKVSLISSFFASQPYVHSVRFKTHETPSINLDDFRAKWMQLRRTGAHHQYNLCELFLLTFNLPLNLANEQWIEFHDVLSDYARYNPPVLFSRSVRYRNRQFPWEAVLEKYKHDAAFIGTNDEWADFDNTIGHIPHIATPTLLDAAYLISRCHLFAGNQSALMAIAIGVQVPTILQESWQAEPNCLFPCVTSCLSGSMELPDI